MSTSTFATDRWTKILYQKRDLFGRIGSNDAIALVNSRASFRYYFEAECDRINEKWTQRALGKLDISFDHMESFIRILEDATLNQGSRGYIGLIWGACFSVIQCVCANGTSQISAKEGLDSPNGPVQLVADLNHALPRFDEDLQHGNELSVQEALQDIFVSYIDCCLSMISLLTGRTLLSSRTRESYPTSLRACIENAAEEFVVAKAQFVKATSILLVNGARPRATTSYDSSRRSIPGSWPSSTQWQIPDTYQIIKNLGTGASGYVEKVADTSDGRVYARKHMKLQKGQNWSKFRSRVWDEIANMRKVACVHVVNVDFHQEDSERAMEIYMTPVADGNLMEILDGWVDGCYPNLSPRTIYSWFGCLLTALAYVHSKDVLHKDIKPSNILVKDNLIYLADFGLSKDFEGGISQSVGPFAGTFEYQAPEFVTNQGHGRPVDVYALGCVFSEMLTAAHREDLSTFKDLRLVSVPLGPIEMYKAHSFHKNMKRVREWVVALRGDEKDNALVGIILSMLEIDSAKRISSREALKRLKNHKDLCCTHGL